MKGTGHRSVNRSAHSAMEVACCLQLVLAVPVTVLSSDKNNILVIRRLTSSRYV